MIFLSTLFLIFPTRLKFNSKPEKEVEADHYAGHKMHPQVKTEFICFYYVFRFAFVNISLELTFICCSHTIQSRAWSPTTIKTLSELNGKKSEPTLWTSSSACKQFLILVTRFKWIFMCFECDEQYWELFGLKKQHKSSHKDHKNMISKQ